MAEMISRIGLLCTCTLACRLSLPAEAMLKSCFWPAFSAIFSVWETSTLLDSTGSSTISPSECSALAATILTCTLGYPSGTLSFQDTVWLLSFATLKSVVMSPSTNRSLISALSTGLMISILALPCCGLPLRFCTWAMISIWSDSRKYLGRLGRTISCFWVWV